MKTTKIIAALLLMAMALVGTTGCIQKKPTQTTATQETVSGGNREGREGRDRTTYGTYAIPDTGRNNLVEMQVDSVEVVVWEQTDMLNTKTSIHNFIKVHIVLTNLGEEDIDLQTKDIRGFIDNEQLRTNTNEAAYEALGIKGNVIEGVTIHSGRSETGYVLFEYFRDWVEFEVQYKDTALDFGIVFDENSVITLRTTINSDSSNPSGSSSEPSDTSNPSETGPIYPEPTGSGTVSVPTETAPVQTDASDLPGITIPVAGG